MRYQYDSDQRLRLAGRMALSGLAHPCYTTRTMQGPPVQPDHQPTAARRMTPRDLLPSIARARLLLAGLIATAILSAIAVGFAIVVGLGLLLDAADMRGSLDERLPRLANAGILLLPLLCWIGALLLQRRGGGRTFYQQIRDNRWASILLVAALVGVLVATADLIAAVLVYEAEAGLLAAAIAAVLGVLIAIIALTVGREMVTWSVHARPIADQRLDNVVNELAIASGLPVPRVLVVEDPSPNAFAVGRDPSSASVVVTRGLLEQLDREELQGVIAHELAHIRNGDSRYGLLVAILVGLVALLADGFLRGVIEAWKQGAFLQGASDSDDPRGAIAGLAAGVVIGLVLLVVALMLRVFAPLFAALVQAAVSRERELLADATSVAFTRNPIGLERALETIRQSVGVPAAANRGTQHLWFVNPVDPGSDGAVGLFATHPTIETRIARLRMLRGESVVEAEGSPQD